LRVGQERSANPAFIAFDPMGPDIPHEISTRIRGAEAELQPLGFSAVRSYTLNNLLKNASGFVTLFRNGQTGEVAKLIAAKAQTSVVTVESKSIVFFSAFNDGTELITSNSQSPKIWPALGPPIHSMVFPELVSAADLYAVHRAREEDMAVAARRLDPLRDDPDAFLHRTERRHFEHAFTCGYYEPVPSRATQRPTWKGAILMAWRLTWPIKPILQAVRRSRAQSEIRRLGLAWRSGRIVSLSRDFTVA
jgi:hypothetical protein